MKYVGLDLSLTKTGVCVLNPFSDGETCVLKTIESAPRKNEHVYARVDGIVTAVMNLLPKPDDCLVCVEKSVTYSAHAAGLDSIKGVNWMMRREMCFYGYQWLEPAPMQLKKFVIGEGKGEKSKMMMMVLDRWNVRTGDDNQADAYGLAQLAKIAAALKNGEKPDVPQFQIDVAKKVIGGK